VKPALTSVLFAATAALAGAQQSSNSIDREKLELIRKMSPEERAALKARLEQLKKLPSEERARLQDNLKKIKAMPAEEVRKLKERATKLTPEEFKDYSDLAQGFGRWAHRMGQSEGFPRGVFFTWLKSEKPEKMTEIRSLEPGPGSPRVNEFIKLAYEFRSVTLARTEQHVQKHRCVEVSELKDLREASPSEFWPRWQEANRACQGRKANPGPVPPRPLK
jgi:hypothetical protein